jgi:hypothetical protein
MVDVGISGSALKAELLLDSLAILLRPTAVQIDIWAWKEVCMICDVASEDGQAVK